MSFEIMLLNNILILFITSILTYYTNHHFRRTECQVCKKTLARRLGKQGYECRDCLMKCHKHCHVKVDNSCSSSTIQSIEM